MKIENNNQQPAVIHFDYNGNLVSFEMKEKVMVNATEMAKSFGREKRPQFWLNNQSTQEFIKELAVARNLATEELVQIKQGGAIQGTWMHEDVALEFARWLSPKFAIWCNDRIKELVNNRMQAPATFQSEALLQSMQQLADLTTQNFILIRNEIAGIDERLRAIEQRRQPEALHASLEKREERHDQMDLVIVNFQQPVYLNRKMKQYCVMKHLSIRAFLNDLIISEIIKETKI